MSINTKLFTPNGVNKIFSSDVPIKGKDYVGVYVSTSGLTDSYVRAISTEYEVVNDSVVFYIAPTGLFLRLLVATNRAELVNTPSNIAMVATFKDNLQLIADNLDYLINLSGILPEPIVNPIAYCDYSSNSVLALTNVFQKATLGFTEGITPVNITETNGVFVPLVGGIYKYLIQRVYHQHDSSPLPPIELFIEMRVNGVATFSSTSMIGASTSPQEPVALSFTTPFIGEMFGGEQVTFWFKATEGTGSPSNTELVYLKVVANKIHPNVS